MRHTFVPRLCLGTHYIEALPRTGARDAALNGTR